MLGFHGQVIYSLGSFLQERYREGLCGSHSLIPNGPLPTPAQKEHISPRTLFPDHFPGSHLPGLGGGTAAVTAAVGNDQKQQEQHSA